MSPNDFLNKLDKLAPDTPLTIEHLISIIKILDKGRDLSYDKNIDTTYSTWDREDTINEVVLGKWINKSTKTIQDWRGKGKGPKFIKDEGGVSYRVGTVMDWIKSREVQSTTQADTLKFGSIEYDSIFPTIYIDNIATPFFDTIRENEDDYLEMNFTGYQTLWTEKDSLSSLYLSSHELGISAELLVNEILKIKEQGTDLNKLESILINNEAHSINLSHLIALNSLEFNEYSVLVKDLYNEDLNFELQDSRNITAIDYANEIGNEHLISMLNSLNLYKKLQADIPNK